MLADHTGFGGGYAVQGLYVLHGPSIAFDNVKHIYLGTDENPMVNTYAITAHSGTVTAKGFESFVVRSSNGIWATNSGGQSEINLQATENGVIDIKTDSFAVDVDAWDYTEGYKNTQTINLSAKSISLVSTEGRAVIIGSGIEGAESTLNITASNAVNIEGATDGIQMLGYQNGADARLNIKAGTEVVISGGESAISDTALGKSDNAKIDITVPSVTFNGSVDAASSDMVLQSGKEGQTAQVKLNNGDFHVASLAGEDVSIEATFDEKLGTFAIGANTTDHTNVSVTGDAVSTLSQAEAKKYIDEQVELGKEADYRVAVENPAWMLEEVADAQGKVSTSTRASELTETTMDLAAMTMVAWRNETTNVTDRMASLRTNSADYGAWARYNGGEYQYDARDVSNQFNTIEVGGDIKLSDSWVVGASFSYTKGNGDFAHGENDSDTYAGALYALWTHEKGAFVDVMAKVGQLSSDFEFNNISGVDSEKGSLDQTGFIFGVETGHRFSLPMNTFIEPQFQLTYSRLGSDRETTSVREINIESTDSLIARLGAMGGMTFADNKGAVYARVSALHDFLGDVEGSFRATGNADKFVVSEELDDTWVEFSVGGDYRIGKNTIIFADVQRSSGGDIDLDWRANVGAKFVW